MIDTEYNAWEVWNGVRELGKRLAANPKDAERVYPWLAEASDQLVALLATMEGKK